MDRQTRVVGPFALIEHTLQHPAGMRRGIIE